MGRLVIGRKEILFRDTGGTDEQGTLRELRSCWKSDSAGLTDYWDGVVRSWGQSRRGEPSVTKHRRANLLQSVLPSMTATKPHVTLSPGKVAGAMEKLNFI